jgi:hypothetical protein
MTDPNTYKVTFRPLASANVYQSSATDVTTYVRDRGLSRLTYKLDTYDFDIGAFHFGNMTIGCVNEGGYFNETEDLFSFKRDLTKVVLSFFDTDETEYTFFKGVIAEPMTRFNKNNETVNFTVINQDQILNQTQVLVADISDTDSFSDAIKAILNKTRITSILNYSADNINVDYDGVIDVASELQGRDVYTVLKKLLQASNSLFYIDADDNMIVTSRASTGVETRFYGAEDPFNRDNIIEVNGYTTGYNRIFNSIVVNDRATDDATSIGDYGLRQKRYTFSFVTDNTREDLIAANILAEFKDPKKEVSITVPIEDGQALDFLDDIVLFLESSGYNNINIDEDDTFKLMARDYDSDNFSAILKLREI